ncbi:UDP-N-acetylmuramoyl-L-alanine--D-glutamate ligase [Poseidonibacter ostreae]|jgi:UDP-N-acetylmuramoylalanine--D-glutamate ligase|uniref:UDP-N-acetylmuramoylalanine--D-glutamate ligase n=1 Tax=Poseidonibacter ostreae TaxID=2654171 RepID=A0A6L4WSX3_9BACT|nr:UDP-N-acetylmuramoyl-L-alanine--D-glutamate ligase [Poseidonibacter ostreae]KAB7886256.1 UDP-N-acetylmuramoyl-L-alanine--D-glutamate ligase [Poseidonibacter ostreae]KAB7888913.1 UDP-N-acetylmuramoyl-L-alanine--D-glutamate ligase [Poseidonibacter ostreae]KAB7889348.1 UDP-N-acetylmuramoyl-L-alanine--D-glutamate ligase [Poseidonibacter ostreae]MAC84179.1 UDP-N-acetylmuramoyl-L-alanine--D-glutamate ligase [Arcobacter sp.]|tara:strand:+ start:1071 stop:2246 length:1176 start_codon:yes stop_codon:yes gene_type:complete
MNLNDEIRVLGKGLTAQAIKDKFPNAILYDDKDFELYDKSSNEKTIVSPGIPPYNEMIKKANNIQSDYDLFSELMPFSIWISGTNGKTTTTQMCQHILANYNSVYGGNIGTPLSKLDTKASIWILETSSFTLHYTNIAKPNLYLLLPISEDHITWHGSFKEYENAKLKPLSFMEEGEIAIIPEKYKDYKTKAYKIIYKNSDDLCNKFDIDKSKIKFKEPFLLDALLALAAKKIIFDEIDYEKINSFTIDEHKVEEFIDNKNRIWVNDSKATNVDATINALVPYKDMNIHIILGGDDKGADLLPLFENIKQLNITVYAIGSNIKRIENYCKTYNIKIESCEKLEKAVKKINENLKENSIGILSPAAASLDQFSSYAQRGKEFKSLVLNLSKL